jgi:hypothetical protein
MLLIDTDMLVLLAASGLLDRAVTKLGYETKDVRRLAAATHQIRKSKALRDQYGAEALEAALPRIVAIAVVAPAANMDLLDLLNESMDPGEAQLVAVAAGKCDTLLISGDKRAIRDLVACGNADCIQSMQGRIVTLEALLWILLQELEPKTLHAALLVAGSHKTLRIVFSESNLASSDGCALAVRSYFIDASQGAAGLLYNPDPSPATTARARRGG